MRSALNYAYTGGLFGFIMSLVKGLSDSSISNELLSLIIVVSTMTLFGFLLGLALGVLIQKGYLKPHQ